MYLVKSLSKAFIKGRHNLADRTNLLTNTFKQSRSFLFEVGKMEERF